MTTNKKLFATAAMVLAMTGAISAAHAADKVTAEFDVVAPDEWNVAWAPTHGEIQAGNLKDQLQIGKVTVTRVAGTSEFAAVHIAGQNPMNPMEFMWEHDGGGTVKGIVNGPSAMVKGATLVLGEDNGASTIKVGDSVNALLGVQQGEKLEAGNYKTIVSVSTYRA